MCVNYMALYGYINAEIICLLVLSFYCKNLLVNPAPLDVCESDDTDPHNRCWPGH